MASIAVLCSALPGFALHAAPHLAHAPQMRANLVMGGFDVRTGSDDKLDLSYQVAMMMNAAPEKFTTLQTVLKAAEKEIESNAKAKAELGVYRGTDNIIGFGERPDGTVLIRFFGIFSKKNPNALIPGTQTRGKGTSYSCNISCTAEIDGSKVTVTKLSCAKDEGWGRTVDLICVDTSLGCMAP